VIVEQVLGCVVMVERVVVGGGRGEVYVERLVEVGVEVQGASTGLKYVPHPSEHCVGQAVYSIFVGRRVGHSQGTGIRDSMIQSGCGQKVGVRVGQSGCEVVLVIVGQRTGSIARIVAMSMKRMLRYSW